MLKSLLDEAGIDSTIRNESAYSMFPGASFQPEIWVVHEEDYAEARRICDAWREAASSEVSGQEAEGSKQSRPASALGPALCGLFFLCLAVIARKRFAITGDPRNAVGAVLLGLLAAVFLWFAATIWTARKKRL